MTNFLKSDTGNNRDTKPQSTTYDLLDYKEQRIIALVEEVQNLRINEERLTTIIFELIDKDCPEEYKRIIKSELFDLWKQAKSNK